MPAHAFVPDDFPVPQRATLGPFRLEPLGPRHNEADHAAWSSSIEHIRATPGFVGRGWPPVEGMSLEANLADLERHRSDFDTRAGFTYTVLEGGEDGEDSEDGEDGAEGADGDDGEVIGCVYIYPSRTQEHVTTVRSWVRADRAEFDKPLYDAVSAWLRTDWPWPLPSIHYAPR
ncbi:N-acetyltransferase [Streptomyces sp. NPDC003077]|uniref:N-acetyltransferase n=1 Tax=Streptomyces sp. NPDC003077 TaxID=3154443 RepID=UPI0033A882B9